ncbi:MAG: cytidylate kinase family protein [Candidatus Micrarchaeota archaeon]
MRIAVSGLSGCGNTTVSAYAAKILRLRPVNYTMRSLAKDIGISFGEAMALRLKDGKLDLLLDLRQSELAKAEGVILSSRLAIWLMPAADLRVWLSATPEVRARRIAKRENKTYRQALAETCKRDRQDVSQYKRLYGIDASDTSQADLVINTEWLDAQEVAAIIAGAARPLKRRRAAQSEAYNKIAAAIMKKLKFR